MQGLSVKFVTCEDPKIDLALAPNLQLLKTVENEMTSGKAKMTIKACAVFFGILAVSLSAKASELICEEESASESKLVHIYTHDKVDYAKQAAEISFEQLRSQRRRIRSSLDRALDRQFNSNQESTEGWTDKAAATEIEILAGAEARLFRAYIRYSELENSKTPLPVLRSLDDIQDFANGKLPAPPSLAGTDLDQLVSDEEKPIGARAARLSNYVRASIQVAEKMPVSALADDDEVNFILKTFTNPRALYAFLSESENETEDRQQIGELLQKVYWIKGLKSQATLATSEALRERQLEALDRDPNRFFDAIRFPAEAAFLKQIGAQPIESVPESVDLSGQFKKPSSQCLRDGTPTYACTSFAVLSDMETHAEVPELSKGQAYGLAVANIVFYDRMVELIAQDIRRIEREVRREGRINSWRESQIAGEIDRRANENEMLVQRWNLTQNGFAAMADIELPGDLVDRLKKVLSEKDFEKAMSGQLSGTIPPVMMHILEDRPALPEKDFPWPQMFTDDYSQLPTGGYQIAGFATTQSDDPSHAVPAGVRDFDFYRLILANQIPLSFSYNTDARFSLENWMYPVDSGSDSAVAGHIINVVGYGVEPDPISGRPTPYLLVRDSLQPQSIHWKTPAHEILPRAGAVHRVTEVKKVD